MVLFKVGDKVRIKKREGSVDDYRFGFTENMSKLAGEIAVITACYLASAEGGKIPDDGYLYQIEIDGRIKEFNWASSMLEPIRGSNPTSNFIVINDEDSIKLNFKL